jgi:hypothetical protein
MKFILILLIITLSCNAEIVKMYRSYNSKVHDHMFTTSRDFWIEIEQKYGYDRMGITATCHSD